MRNLGRILFLAGWLGVGLASAQVYVSDPVEGTVTEYDEDSGQSIDGFILRGLDEPEALAVADGRLYVVEKKKSRIGVYDAGTGSIIDEALVTGLSYPQALAVSGDALYVTNFDARGISMIGKYNARTGVGIDAWFIRNLEQTTGIAISDDTLLVITGVPFPELVSFDATTGQRVQTLSPSLPRSEGLAISGPYVWISDRGAICKYDLRKGSRMDFAWPFIRNEGETGAMAVSGDNLFTSERNGTVRKYQALTGALLNASFIPGGGHPVGLAAVAKPLSADPWLTFNKNQMEYVLFAVAPYIKPVVSIGVGLLITVVLGFLLRRKRDPVPVELPPEGVEVAESPLPEPALVEPEVTLDQASSPPLEETAEPQPIFTLLLILFGLFIGVYFTFKVVISYFLR